MSENYYHLLGLNPDDDDPERIKIAIDRKKKEWAKTAASGPPKSRKAAEKNVKLIPTIEAALSDDKRRNEIRREAIEQRNESRQAEKTSTITELGKLIEIQETIYESFVDHQVKHFKERLTRQEIESTITERHGKVIVPGTPSPSSLARQLPTLETSKAKDIRAKLRDLDLKSLYKFLELHQYSDLDALQKAAEKIARETGGRGPGVRGSADRSAVAGYCKSVFANRGMKDRYDNTLAFEPLDDENFGQFIENLVASDGSGLDVVKVLKLVNWAQGKGVEAEVAGNYIATYASNKNLECTSIDSALREIQAGSRAQSFRFLGISYRSEKELASAVSDPAKWSKFCRSTQEVGSLLNWLDHTLGNSDTAEQVRKYLGNRDDLGTLSSEVGRCMAIHALDTRAPFIFKGFRLSGESIARIAEGVNSDIEARRVPRILDLYKSDVLRHLCDEKLPGSEEFREIFESWENGIRVYEAKYKTILHADPPQDDNIVARLVSVTTPGSNTTEGLRSYVMNNTSKRAFECDWFRDIGDPAHCGGAELLLLFQLHQHALSDALSNLNSSLAELNRQKVSCSLGPLESRAMIGGIVGLVLGLLWWFATGLWGDYRYVSAGGAEILAVVGLVVAPFVLTYALETFRQAAHNRTVESEIEVIRKAIEEFGP